MSSNELLTWYDRVKRELPWRESKDPYRVWISEIMLQQTQVATVISYFNRFIEKYPNVIALAHAHETDVFKLWEGLGYYSRARNLIRCAKTIHETHGGVFPGDAAALEKLPGIGPYTAGAVASIAFDERVPAVDGNVLRVVSRLYCVDLPIDNPKNMSVFKAHVMSMMTERPGDFNQALMELGATICTPKTFKCEACPLRLRCCARRNDTISQYPNKPKKPDKRIIAPIIIVVSSGSEIMLIKHPNEGLLANLWGFPRIDVDQTSNVPSSDPDGEVLAKLWVIENLGKELPLRAVRSGVSHIFTHIKWVPKLYFFESTETITVDFPEVDWIRIEQLEQKALPTAFHKQMKIVMEEVLK